MRAEREHIGQVPDISWRFHIRREATFAFTWHYHPEVELTLITRGSGTRIVGDSIDHYRPGDLTLIGADLPHTFVSAPGTPHNAAIVIQFHRDFLGPDLLARPEFNGIAQLLDQAANGVCFRTQPGLSDSLVALPDLPPLERTLSLLKLLAQLSRQSGARLLVTQPANHPVAEPARRRIEAACAYLQSAYRQEVRLADVAAAAHMSPTGFSRFFRRALGRTVTDYVTELRIAAACQLLADTDLAIADVAARSGYANLSNFNRRFRSLKGVTPRAYRNAIAGRHVHESPLTGSGETRGTGTS